MDPADNASAIDDSYEPIHFHPRRPSGPGLGGTPVTLQKLGYTGPRSGHWTVKNTVVGSGIDDGCPTIHHFPATNYDSSGHVQPLASSVIRRLAKATQDEKKAEQEQVVGAEKSEKLAHAQTQAAAPEKLQLPKGFFVPKTDVRGIRIAGKDGRKEVVRHPQYACSATVIRKEKQQQKEDEPKETQARAPSPQPSVKPQKAASLASHRSQQSMRAVRIAGKGGEEVFTYIPIIPAASKSVSRAQSAAQVHKPEETKAAVARDNKDEKAQRDANAAKAVKQLREERALQTQIEQQRERDAKIAAEALMSGALPASAKSFSARSAASVPSGKSSAKDSGVVFRVGSRNTSKTASVASSKTSVQQSQKAGSVKSGAQVSSEAASVKRAVQATQKAPSERSKSQSRPGWQEIGVGTFDPAPSKGSERPAVAQSSQANGATRVHSFHNRFGFEELDARDVHDRSRSAGNDTRKSSGQQPTIFAGRGWISPHPLSRPPSEFEWPPDLAIQLPGRNGIQEGTTMTYDEWMKIRQGEETHPEKFARRNFSRSSSDGGRYAGGSWGFRNVTVAESIREEGPGRRYQGPAVESVRSDETYEHDFDSTIEDGKTQLGMPWDDRRGW